MSDRTASEDGLGFAPDDEIVKEAVWLLGCTTIRNAEGDFKQGRNVSVLIDPEWDDESQELRVVVTCYAPARSGIPWEKLAVSARGESCTRFARLDRRGQAFLELPEGEYRFSAHYRSLATILPAPMRALAAAAVDAYDPPALRAPKTISSASQGIDVTLVPSKTGIKLAFQSRRRELAGKTIELSFVDRSGNENERHQFQLQPRNEVVSGQWTGVVKEDGELVYRVLEEE